jgi:hypothetical protein
MRRRILNKPWVVDGGQFWDTKTKTGQFKLQQHDETDNIWDYEYRIIEVRDVLPSRLVATANALEEIAKDWKHFTGQKWP